VIGVVSCVAVGWLAKLVSPGPGALDGLYDAKAVGYLNVSLKRIVLTKPSFRVYIITDLIDIYLSL
jgi:hypothetical protein